MATPVIMPKMGMTMDEGTVIQWFKKEGESIEKGQPLLEIMTDKVNMEVEAPATGLLRGITAGPDTTVPVATVIAYIAEASEALPVSVPLGHVPSQTTESSVVTAMPVTAGDERVIASPLARRLAGEAKLDLRALRGSGPRGRIVEADVKAALEARSRPVATATPVTPLPPPVVSAGPSVQVLSGTLVPLAGKRKVIAERMSASARVPQFALGLDADMTHAEEARGSYSVTAFLVRVVAHSLKHHPFVNASLRQDGIWLHEDINIGVAVSADDGLIVPVIKQAGQKSLATLDQELKSLAERARAGTLSLDDVTGGTFTISNLGMVGVEEFRALLNPPEAAILAAGRTMPRPVVSGDSVVVRPMLRLVLSVDHRVLDGVTAAAFLVEIKRLLENPYELL